MIFTSISVCDFSPDICISEKQWNSRVGVQIPTIPRVQGMASFHASTIARFPPMLCGAQASYVAVSLFLCSFGAGRCSSSHAMSKIRGYALVTGWFHLGCWSFLAWLFCGCRFVEIMAPVFSRKAWRCIWYIIQVSEMYGLLWRFGHLCHECHLSIIHLLCHHLVSHGTMLFSNWSGYEQWEDSWDTTDVGLVSLWCISLHDGYGRVPMMY